MYCNIYVHLGHSANKRWDDASWMEITKTLCEYSIQYLEVFLLSSPHCKGAPLGAWHRRKTLTLVRACNWIFSTCNNKIVVLWWPIIKLITLKFIHTNPSILYPSTHYTQPIYPTRNLNKSTPLTCHPSTKPIMRTYQSCHSSSVLAIAWHKHKVNHISAQS